MLEEAQAREGEEVTDAVLPDEQATQRDQAARGRSRLLAKAFDEKLESSQEGDRERAGAALGAEESADGMAAQRRGGDFRTSEARSNNERDDQGRDDRALKERGQANTSAATSRGVQLGQEKGSVNDQGRQGQKGSGGNSDQGSAGPPPGFRFNPALMAPVPVARPKDVAGSARLRAVANEIAQKIVERVRVGQNVAGASEFQIDLRSNVLAGLSIKVSSKGGKISAVFSGKDREVLKLLKEQGDALKSALSGRGLELADFRVEESA
jgi:hypothetical protein